MLGFNLVMPEGPYSTRPRLVVKEVEIVKGGTACENVTLLATLRASVGSVTQGSSYPITPGEPNSEQNGSPTLQGPEQTVMLANGERSCNLIATTE